MTTLSITPGASAHLREMIAADRLDRSVLVVAWENAEADLTRGPRGEATWSRGKPAHWKVIRIHPAETKNLKVREIDQFSVVLDWPEGTAPNSALTIDYVNGELIVI